MKDKLRLMVRRFSRSRDFTISFLLHVIVIALFLLMMGRVIKEPPPPEMKADIEDRQDPIAQTSPPTGPSVPVAPDPGQMETPAIPNNSPAVIQTTNPNPALQFSNSAITTKPVSLSSGVKSLIINNSQKPSETPGSKIGPTVKSWQKDTPNGSEASLHTRQFSFTIFVGQYSGGNWNSTARVENGHVTGGSMPNLLYYLDKVSDNRIQGNGQNVRVISLGSDELLSVMPPFVFLTGTRDFILTDQEVQNIRTYLQNGGAIWGDSSVPGRRSRFDIAFRREMRRVIPDKGQGFEPLGKDHPLFTKGYFPEIRSVVPGLNHYDEPVYAMKLYGQVAILYTANDYADMWQIGLYTDPKTHKTAIDMRQSIKGDYVAINPAILSYEGTYLHNLSPQSLENSYKFGANIIVHFLTRWDDLLRTQRL